MSLDIVYTPYIMLMNVKDALTKRIIRISDLNQAGAIDQKTTEEFFDVLGKTICLITEIEPRYKTELGMYDGYIRRVGQRAPNFKVDDFTINSVDDNVAIMASKTIKLIKLFSDYASIDVDSSPHKPHPELKALIKTSMTIWPALEKKIDLFKDMEERIYASRQQQEEERRISRES